MAAADPELALRLAKATADLYGDAVARLLDVVARRLARGITEEGWAERKLLEVTALRDEAQAEIQRLTGDTSVVDAVDAGYTEGAKRAARDLADPTITGSLTGTNRQAVQALVEATQQAVSATHLRILRSVDDAYRAVIAEASLPGVVTGADSRRQAAQRALERFARRGVTGFVDNAGRHWELESYVEMATRTGAGRAMVQGRLDSYQVAGRDLVIVSDAPEECSVCRPWEGGVLSIRGDGQHPTVAEATSAGLFHANCRHDLRPFIPGLTKRMTHTADPVNAGHRERQRALERRVRANRRQVMVDRAFVDVDGDPAARARLRRSEATLARARGDLASFAAEHDRKRLRYRETVGRAR